MAYKCVIVDDERLARKILLEYADEVPDLEVVAECKSALEANSLLALESIDILFLDIQMPHINGINFIRQLENPPLVIFTTAYSEYAVEAFEVEAFDYLVKPISFERFYSSFSRAQKELSKKDEITPTYITIKESRRLYRVNLEDILYIQAYGDYVRIFAPEKTYVSLLTLSQMSELLDRRFMQIHRSYIVNLDRIHFMEGNHLVIGDNQIPVSASYKDNLIHRLSI